MRTYLSKRVKSSVNEYLSSSIKSATKWSEGGGDVDKFLEWHDDPEMFRNYSEVFDAIYKIFDDVLGENQSENVGEAFQRLSKKDQERIMRLVESTGYDIKSATNIESASRGTKGKNGLSDIVEMQMRDNYVYDDDFDAGMDVPEEVADRINDVKRGQSREEFIKWNKSTYGVKGAGDIWDIISEHLGLTSSINITASSSDTFLDPQGMFSEPGSTVTFNELKAYWDENQNSDPILSEYSDFNSWYNETIQWFQPIGELLDSGVRSVQDAKQAIDEYVDDKSATNLDLEDYIHELATMVVNRIAEQGYFCDYDVTSSELTFTVYVDEDMEICLGVFTQPIIEIESIGSDLSSDADLLAKDILLAVK